MHTPLLKSINFSVAYFYKNKKIILSIISIMFIVIIASVYYSFVMLPIIINATGSKVKSMTTSAINNAVFYSLTEKTDYNNLVTIYSDNLGKINMIQANSVKINTLARETSKYSQEAINKMGENGIDIHLGSLTGIELLVGFGPLIHFKTLPVGTVNADFYSEFTSAGINQTRHRIYIIVEANVEVILPFIKKEIICNTPVLVCESILLGEVPNTYLKLDGESLYNLLPNSLTN